MTKGKKIIEALKAGALSEIEKKFGVKLMIGRGTVDGGSLSLKVQFADVAANGLVSSKEAEDFKRNAIHYGLKPEHLGQTLTFRGEAYKLVGLRTRAPRFPFLVERVSDKKLSCLTEASVQRGFAASPAKPLFASVPVKPAPSVPPKADVAKLFFSQPRTDLECDNVLRTFGIEPPADRLGKENAIIDLFLEEMVDNDLNFKH